MTDTDSTTTRRGPRTVQGKATVSRNALKHGLTARKHPVLHWEDTAAYRAFRDEVHTDLRPVGRIEASLADQVADCLWRSDRAKVIEAACMEEAFRTIHETGAGVLTPAQRFQRAIAATLNNDLVEPVHRYQRELSRELFRCLHELDIRQTSRRLNLPARNLRITVSAQDIRLPETAVV